MATINLIIVVMLVFQGLSDVIQGQGDPGISLVSEGSATIILLSKMHFLQQASATLMTSLRSKVSHHTFNNKNVIPKQLLYIPVLV